MGVITVQGNKSTTTSVTLVNANNAWGVEVGDIFVAFVCSYRSVSLAPGTISFTSTTSGTSWATPTARLTASYYRSSTSWMRAAAADVNTGSSLTYTFGSTSATQMACGLVVLRDRQSYGTPVAIVNTAYVTSDTTIRAASITPAYDDSVLIYAGYYYTSSTVSTTLPANYTNITNQETGRLGLRMAYRTGQLKSASGNVDSTAGATCTVKHAFHIDVSLNRRNLGMMGAGTT